MRKVFRIATLVVVILFIMVTAGLGWLCHVLDPRPQKACGHKGKCGNMEVSNGESDDPR
jgi:hypothetical protein